MEFLHTSFHGVAEMVRENYLVRQTTTALLLEQLLLCYQVGPYSPNHVAACLRDHPEAPLAVRIALFYAWTAASIEESVSLAIAQVGLWFAHAGEEFVSSMQRQLVLLIPTVRMINDKN